MRKTLKWTLPAALVAVALVGWSFRSAVAQTAAKGKVTVTVKGPMGEVGSALPVNLYKGTVQMPAFAGGGGRRGGGGGGGGGGAPGGAPASQPALPPALMTGTTDAKGMYTFENVDAGDITVIAGAMGGGGGRRGGGGGGAAAGGPPTTAPGVRGRGLKSGTVTAGEELKLEVDLMAGGGRRGGGGGGGGRRGGGGGAGGAAGAGAGA